MTAHAFVDALKGHLQIGDRRVGSVKVEGSNSSLYKGAGAPSRETRVSMRAKSGAPAVVAKYLAEFLNKVARDVPPRFTHTKV